MNTVMQDPLLPSLCQVTSRHSDTGDTFTLTLAPPTGYGRFSPGQFNMLYVPGAGEAAISISGDPGEPGRLVHTIRAVGNVTRLMQKLEAPDVVGVRGPFGRPWPMAEARGKDLVIVGGGIGLAPLRPVILSVLTDRDAYGRVTLLYGARTPSDILYPDEITRWKQQGIDLFVTVDAGDRHWSGDVGVITGCIGRATFDVTNAVAMVCGPEIMIRFAVNKLRDAGMHREQVYVSLERNMKCAVGYCGHCQFGPHFVCRDGPVFAYDQVESSLMTQDL